MTDIIEDALVEIRNRNFPGDGQWFKTEWEDDIRTILRLLAIRARQSVTYPRGMTRKIAAWYVGVDEKTFGMMVKEGTMPPPAVFTLDNSGPKVKEITRWDRRAIDQAFDKLPDYTGE